MGMAEDVLDDLRKRIAKTLDDLRRELAKVRTAGPTRRCSKECASTTTARCRR